MRNSLLLLLISFTLSCNSKSGDSNIINKDKMEAVIWDLMRIDEVVNEKHRKDSTVNKFRESVSLYKRAFQIHNISEEQFKTSFKYYQSDPGSLKPILDSLQTKGNNMTSVFKPAAIE
jgi:poly-D-alanine transfer protein DltD